METEKGDRYDLFYFYERKAGTMVRMRCQGRACGRARMRSSRLTIEMLEGVAALCGTKPSNEQVTTWEFLVQLFTSGSIF